MAVSKTSDNIKIKIKMPNSGQEPPGSSKVPYEDLKDIDVLCTFKSRKGAQIWNIGISRASDHIQIKIKIPNPGEEPPSTSKAPN